MEMGALSDWLLLRKITHKAVKKILKECISNNSTGRSV